MASAGSIFVDLLLNTSEFITGTKKGSKGMSDFEKSVSKSAKAATAAIAATAAAISALTIKQLHSIDASVKQARSLGIVTEEFQALALLADEAGVAQENLGNLIGKGQKAIFEAAQGAEKYTKAFKSLNLEIKDLIDLTPDEQFRQIAEALSDIENPTVRNATAMQIFGKSGREVVNMLEDFSEKAAEAREFNDRFNISVSEIDGRKVEEANDTFQRLFKAIGGFGNTIAIEVAPLITELSNRILKAGVDGEEFTSVVQAGMNAAATAVDVLVYAVKGISIAFDELKIVAAGTLALIAENAYEAGQNIANVLNFLSPGKPFEAEDAFKRIGEAAQTAAAQADESIQNTIKELQNYKGAAAEVAAIQEAANERAKNASGKGGVIPDVEIENVQEAARVQKELASIYEKNRGIILGVDDATLKYSDTIEGLNKLLQAGTITQEQYNRAVKGAQDEFDKATAKAQVWAFDMEAAGKRASENIQDALAEFLFDPADKGFKGMLKGFVDTLRKMAAEAAAANILKNLFGADGIGGKGGLLSGLFDKAKTILPDIKLGSIPKFADGGFLEAGQWGIAGEKEAELIYGGRTGKTIIPPSANGGGNRYVFNVGTEVNQRDLRRLETMVLAAAGPGVIEKRVNNAQVRGDL